MTIAQPPLKNRSLSPLNDKKSTHDLLEKPTVTQKSSFSSLKKYQLEEEDNSSTADSSTITLPNIKFANKKKDHEFHTLFKSVPENERLVVDYGCALQKDILLQGRMYISEHHICFNSNIFGWVTNLVIAFEDIVDIEKKTTAIFIPNSVLISTSTSKHFFASFLTRDQAYDQMVDMWRNCQIHRSLIEIHHDLETSEDDDTDYTLSDDSTDENPPINSLKYQANLETHSSSIASLPIFRKPHLDEVSRRRAMSEAIQRPNITEYIPKEQVAVEIKQSKEKTECECSQTNQHFPNVVMDATFQTTIETMNNLLFHGSFMNTFLSQVEKSTDISIGEWKKSDEEEGVLTLRESSYVKYLGGSIGPKSTKCFLKEKMIHLDTNDFLTQLTITQTPDVPAGGSFSVKTKTCITWSGYGQVRVLVTVLVDFTKSSWLKSTIEKATIDGQQNYYKNLEASLRKYLDSSNPKTQSQTKKKSSKKSKKQYDTLETNHLSNTHSSSELQTVFNQYLNECVRILTDLNTPKLIAICMGIMVITNLYIATKMAGVNNQLNQLGHTKYKQPYERNQKLDDYSFLWETQQDIYQQKSSNVVDDELEYYKSAKYRLDEKLIELEKMILKTGHNMNHVNQIIKDQKQKILNP